jgi:hypothetical protein
MAQAPPVKDEGLGGATAESCRKAADHNGQKIDAGSNRRIRCRLKPTRPGPKPTAQAPHTYQSATIRAGGADRDRKLIP